MGRAALITGVTGQDGSYLAEHLQSHGYEIHGLFRPGEAANASLQAIEVHRHEGELEDPQAVARVVTAVHPDECYHLAAQTFVHGEELSTIRINVSGTLHVLEALRHRAPNCRLFLAGSSEMFGDVEVSPQDESTPLRPRNVYGVSKTAAYQLLRVYREQHGLFACCGILYNHESPRRGPQFVTRKITRAAAQIKLGLETELALGNLDAVRDWGHARDYVRAMRLMLQQPFPDDYVIATGHGRTVRDFVEAAFTAAGLDWQPYVRVAPEYFRPAETIPFVGCPAKAREKLSWTAEVEFAELVAEMVQHDLHYAFGTVRPS
jgi:GDPmannose 4,6-dehydratase